MYSCSVTVFRDGINFVTENIEAYTMIINLSDFFYNDNFKVEDVSEAYKYTLKFTNSEYISEMNYIGDGNYEYYDSWEKIKNTKQLLGVIYQLIEIVRQENCRFLLHASAVSTPYGGIVFMGDSGAGKSSLMLRLCESNDYKMISNDKVVLGLGDNETFYIDVGSKIINLRKSSVDIYNTIINKLIDKKLVYSLRADMKSAENIINSKINEIANQ